MFRSIGVFFSAAKGFGSTIIPWAGQIWGQFLVKFSTAILKTSQAWSFAD